MNTYHFDFAGERVKLQTERMLLTIWLRPSGPNGCYDSQPDYDRVPASEAPADVIYAWRHACE